VGRLPANHQRVRGAAGSRFTHVRRPVWELGEPLICANTR
jgi:hypothetical protein